MKISHDDTHAQVLLKLEALGNLKPRGTTQVLHIALSTTKIARILLFSQVEAT